MPTAPVDNNGTVLSFEDTGTPRGTSTYLTVILVHGILFHGGAPSWSSASLTLTPHTTTISHIPKFGSLRCLEQFAARMREYARLSRLYQFLTAGAGCA